MSPLILGAASFVASLVLTGLVRKFAIRNSVLDRPNERSSHTTPVPRGGGIGILLAAALLGIPAVRGGLISARDALTLGAGMTLLGIIGWIDDTTTLRPRIRFTVHVLVGIWTMWMFGGLPAVRLGTTAVSLGWAGYLVGTVGIVWSINLFNFMDGIDGLAGSQAALIFGTASWLLLSLGNRSMGTMAVLVAGGSLGFLAWNWPPARIFLGDAGSGALGYLAAGMAIGSENGRSVPLLVFGILGGVFILDATITLARRVARGNNMAQAHRDHAYQRLARAVGHHWPVSAGAALVTAILAALSVWGTKDARLLVPLVIAAYVMLTALFVAAERRAPM